MNLQLADKARLTLDQTEATCQFYDEQEHRWWEEHAATQEEVKEREEPHD